MGGSLVSRGTRMLRVLVTHDVEVTGAARLHRAASGLMDGLGHIYANKLNVLGHLIYCETLG